MIGLLLLLRAPLVALADPVDRIEAAIHLRALVYDRAFVQRHHRTLRIAVLASADHPADLELQRRMIAAFQAVGKSDRQLRVSVTQVAYGDNLRARLLSSKSNALYLTPGIQTDLPAIQGIAQELQIPTLCGDLELARRGVVLVVYRQAGKPVLGVHVRTAQATGLRFDSRLFSIARILQ